MFSGCPSVCACAVGCVIYVRVCVYACDLACPGGSISPTVLKSTFYTVSQKQDTKLLPTTSPNVNRFSKIFPWQT